MRDLQNLLNELDQFSTVMIAGSSTSKTDQLLDRLNASGINVIGPVDTASKALALIAQSHVDLAVIDPELAGARNGAELARSLRETWGVRAHVVTHAPA
ncbi:response regulator [Phenylobacterium deserti]|uniref:Response regulatory domain-containing protein n=1 Tax=Phenylobacterium deserti TaxID=1914756 RepID=A0A328APR4_9CAUL|nr:response regulator [Phenylobacterium deserti]RAK56569.1 hypothetical protein DJ018_00875 [Phenylobacterium deserti]